jgi:hypothetical protein
MADDQYRYWLYSETGRNIARPDKPEKSTVRALTIPVRLVAPHGELRTNQHIQYKRPINVPIGCRWVAWFVVYSNRVRVRPLTSGRFFGDCQLNYSGSGVYAPGNLSCIRCFWTMFSCSFFAFVYNSKRLHRAFDWQTNVNGLLF